MPEINRHNKYYFADILCNNSTRSIADRCVTINNHCLELTISGANGALHIKTSCFSPEKWMTFCCHRCAFDYSKTNNVALLFFSSENQNVSLILPCSEDFNNSPIPIPEWSEFDWFCQFYDIIDLTSFGTSSSFPEFVFENIKLSYPSISSTRSLINMVHTKDFMTMFYGSYDGQLAESQKKDMLSEVENLVDEYKSKFGRRGQIEWHILNVNEDFIGFVHLTKFYRAIPNEWVLEFGLRPDYEHRGIMTRAVNTILGWAKVQGCEEVYAISEEFNKKSHSIFKRLDFPAETSKSAMFDEHAGERMMNIYHIKLR